MKLRMAMFAIVAGALVAQNPGIKRTVLQRADLSVPGHEVVMARVEIAPGSFAGRHTHPGEEISYILEGEGEILIGDKPAMNVKAGDSFVIPAGTRHDAHNPGAAPLRMVGVYIVEKGRPMATPAP